MRLVARLALATTAAAAATAGPVGAVCGPAHWACAAVGFGLSLPPAALTLGLTGWLAGRSPYGALLGMVGGVGLRLTVVLVGGVGIFLAARRDGPVALADPLRFWLWVLFAYLATLVAETVLLVRAAPPCGRAGTGG